MNIHECENETRNIDVNVWLLQWIQLCFGKLSWIVMTVSMIVNQLKLCKQNKEITDKFREKWWKCQNSIKHPMTVKSARRQWKLDLKNVSFLGVVVFHVVYHRVALHLLNILIRTPRNVTHIGYCFVYYGLIEFRSHHCMFNRRTIKIYLKANRANSCRE